jgi:hypothetical protein
MAGVGPIPSCSLGRLRLFLVFQRDRAHFLSLDPPLEIGSLKSEKRLKTGTTSVWRFYERHDITFKKKLCTPPNRIVLMSLQRVPS